MTAHRWKLSWVAISIPSLILIEILGPVLAGLVLFTALVTLVWRS